MATLSKANMVTGNTITAADVTQLVDAFTAGGGYSVSISGSVTGSATSASYASTSVSASYSQTSSYSDTLSDQSVSILSTPPVSYDLKLVAGTVQLSAGTGTSGTFGQLAGKQIGVNVFGGASYYGGATGGAQGFDLQLDATGSLIISQVGGATSERVSFLLAYF
jgi:hypothetical protein